MKHIMQAVDEELTREALERYPSSWRGHKVPHHDFSKPDHYDIDVRHADEAQVRRRSGAPDCADVYEGYVPIDRLNPVLAEDTADVQCECLECGHVGDAEDFRGCRRCPKCDSTDVSKGDAGYDWSEFSPRATYPVAEVRILPDGALRLDDGNHRVTYWGDQGFTHAPAWVVDERPCAKKTKKRRRKS